VPLSDAERLALLSAIVDSSDDAIISKSLDGGIITSWNKSAERIFGYTAEEAIGRPITILIPPARLSEETEILTKLRRGERVDHIETVRMRKDGRLIDVSLTISPVRDEAGHIIGASKIAREITERKRADRARWLLSAIVESSDDAIISKSLEGGVITSWNKSAERLFGYTAEEAIGQPVTILTPPDRIDEEPEIISRLRRGERVEHIDTVRMRKGGGLIDISLTISPVHDSAGNIVGASKVARDISESKRLIAELQRANEVLEQFAYSASHDLQEPLRTVKICSEVLQSEYGEQLGSKGAEILEFLHSGASRMENLLRDLLAYVRVTKFEKPSADSDATQAFEDTLESLSANISESNASVTAGPLPRVRVDLAHLHQLFQNLIANAIKYRDPQRPPVVGVSAERQKSQWRFSVRDNGIGIEPQYTSMIFGLFKRLHDNEKYSGTGLGLSICQRIVEQYGGRIWVESKPSEGSVFIFTIPD
jgi:PAS domain S-box-containing protein